MGHFHPFSIAMLDYQRVNPIKSHEIPLHFIKSLEIPLSPIKHALLPWRCRDGNSDACRAHRFQQQRTGWRTIRQVAHSLQPEVIYGPLIDGLPINGMVIFHGKLLNNQMVYIYIYSWILNVKFKRFTSLMTIYGSLVS